MISILIPCYNYSVNKLVQNIHIQTEIEKINYEIICAEDGSTKLFTNSKIKKLKNVRYIINKENIGRSKIRNYLAKKAKYNWLLFIDCDSTDGGATGTDGGATGTDGGATGTDGDGEVVATG